MKKSLFCICCYETIKSEYAYHFHTQGEQMTYNRQERLCFIIIYMINILFQTTKFKLQKHSKIGRNRLIHLIYQDK